MVVLASINFSILLLIAVVHVYWGLGGNWGLQAALPERDGRKAFLPGRFATLVLAILFGCMALFYLYKIDWLTGANSLMPNWLSQYGLWLLAGIFLIRAIGDFRYVGFFKRVNNNRFAKLDTNFYSPLCLLLSVNTFLLISFLS